jgi:thioredoxin-like negative regulator of GroEL
LALTLYERAVAANPKDANARFNLALILRLSGRRPEGDAQMRIAVRLDPRLKDPIRQASASPSTRSS